MTIFLTQNTVALKFKLEFKQTLAPMHKAYIPFTKMTISCLGFFFVFNCFKSTKKQGKSTQNLDKASQTW